ncbi:MAG: fructose-bisphosphate aldolase class I [Legionellales bacterium]|nr:fructose-bisphosphate aldolase class I [Legionellales bacterium]
MSTNELKQTVIEIAARGKGILAADESSGTIAKRFASINLDSTEESRRDYREMLFTTPGLADYISGVILYEETLGQKAQDGRLLADILRKSNIIPGIKVDKGLVPLCATDAEKVTQGLDGLPERLITYKEMGARFAKWRAVFNITDKKPSESAIHTNAHLLARYAAICQAAGIVPIVEPEVLMEGAHDIERCKQVTETVLHIVFDHLSKHKVILEGMILKPNMVTAGDRASVQGTVEEVAAATLNVLLRTVPAAVPSINFLSGGQSAELATAHLNEMHKLMAHLPWNLSFSYGRALQAPCLEAWQGKAQNITLAQNSLLKRAKLNSLACFGHYRDNMDI